MRGRSLGQFADPEDRDHVEQLSEYARSGAELTNQLLGFARGGKYEVCATDLTELVRSGAAMFGRTKKEIRIHGDYVKISVVDTGVGMDEVTRQRIFEPFFTTKEMGRGTGLGLAAVYGTIMNHGGVIEVSEASDKGAGFDIFLPASNQESADEAKSPGENVPGQSEVVLLVDDDQIIIDVGSRMLSRLNYEVLPARGGAEALTLFRQQKEAISLVILDMIMPDMNGAETYRRLKEIDPDDPGSMTHGRARRIGVRCPVR